MRPDFGRHWERELDAWLVALHEGNFRRLHERFRRDAADAQRRAAKTRDPRTDRERWAAEFTAAVQQRELHKLQSAIWAQKRRAQA
jgi:hypothetical protein